VGCVAESGESFWACAWISAALGSVCVRRASVCIWCRCIGSGQLPPGQGMKMLTGTNEAMNRRRSVAFRWLTGVVVGLALAMAKRPIVLWEDPKFSAAVLGGITPYGCYLRYGARRGRQVACGPWSLCPPGDRLVSDHAFAIGFRPSAIASAFGFWLSDILGSIEIMSMPRRKRCEADGEKRRLSSNLLMVGAVQRRHRITVEKLASMPKLRGFAGIEQPLRLRGGHRQHLKSG